MDVRATLVAHFEAAEAVEPGERSLHDPPKSAQPLARFDAAASDARNDATLTSLDVCVVAHDACQADAAAQCNRAVIVIA